MPVVPHRDAALLSVTPLKHATMKIYLGFSHGMLTADVDVISRDLLTFIVSVRPKSFATYPLFAARACVPGDPPP